MYCKGFSVSEIELWHTSEVLEHLCQCSVSHFCKLHTHNCSICTATRYHDDKLTFWLLCLTSTVMSFRWELFSPCRECGLFDESSIAVLLTQTCGLQAFFLVTQHFAYSSFLSCFYLSKSLLIWNKLTPFWLAFLKCLFTERQSSMGPLICGLIKWIYNLLFKDFMQWFWLGYNCSHKASIHFTSIL